MADVKQFELNGTYYPAKDVPARQAIAKLLADVAETFSTASPYAVGDVVIYEGDLYKFTSAHTAGAWDATEVDVVTITDLLALKAPLASPALTGTPTAPTATEEADSTQIATTAFVHSHMPFTVTGNASEGSSVTITDARINSDHWRPDENGIFFGTPNNVASAGTWTTNPTNHTITLTATFTGATTVVIDMHWFQ